MDFSLGAIWDSMGTLARLVAVILLVMGVASLAVFIERVLYFARVDARGLDFAQRSAAHVQARAHAALLDAAQASAGVPLAELVRAGVAAYLKGDAEQQAGTGALSPVELARRALERRVESLKAEARRGFNVLASVGSVCPFVGLFGTVVGIINAFEGIARTGSGGLGAVSAGIAEALIMTAFGLAVAIPAVLAFNYLSGRAQRLDLAFTQSAGELIDHLEQGHGLPRA
jgi:biopolymer transport protein ExbB